MVVSDTVTLAPEVKVDRAVEHETRLSDEAVFLRGRRYFTVAALIGIAVTGMILLWVLWDLWSSSADPFRGAPNDYFYDYQALAMFHGHLNVRNGSLGIEGFLHNDKTYAVFRNLSVHSQNAGPSDHEQVRRCPHGPFNVAGLDHDRSVQLVDAVEASHHYAVGEPYSGELRPRPTAC